MIIYYCNREINARQLVVATKGVAILLSDLKEISTVSGQRFYLPWGKTLLISSDHPAITNRINMCNGKHRINSFEVRKSCGVPDAGHPYLRAGGISQR